MALPTAAWHTPSLDLGGCCCRFLVLVAGTFVYRHGEGVQAAKELAALEGGAAEEGRVEYPPGRPGALQLQTVPAD